MNENAIGERVFAHMRLDLVYPGIVADLFRFNRAGLTTPPPPGCPALD